MLFRSASLLTMGPYHPLSVASPLHMTGSRNALANHETPRSCFKTKSNSNNNKSNKSNNNSNLSVYLSPHVTVFGGQSTVTIVLSSKERSPQRKSALKQVSSYHQPPTKHSEHSEQKHQYVSSPLISLIQPEVPGFVSNSVYGNNRIQNNNNHSHNHNHRQEEPRRLSLPVISERRRAASETGHRRASNEDRKSVG